MNDASALSVPLPRIFETFFSSFSNCSLAISWGSFILERCTARTRIGFSRRSPCNVVSDGLENEGRKKEASNDRAAMFALLLCLDRAGFVKVLVVPHCSVSMVVRAASEGCLRGLPVRVSVRLPPVAASASCEAFRTAACVRGRAAGREQAALGDGCLNSSAETARARVDACRRRGVPEDSGVPGPRETANRRRARGARAATPSTRHVG